MFFESRIWDLEGICWRRPLVFSVMEARVAWSLAWAWELVLGFCLVFWGVC